MKFHKKNSKRQKLSLKYNIEKRVKQTKRRMRKEAKKLGIRKGSSFRKKDPGIPNTWPFKAEMLQELEKKQKQKEAELLKAREQAKKQTKKQSARREAEKIRSRRHQEEERRLKRLEVVEQSQLESLRKVLTTADIMLCTLDVRDPIGCRSRELEAYALDSAKRLIFVLTKCDLVSPQLASQWVQALGREAPTVAVSAEGGRDGIHDLLRMLGSGSEPVPGLPPPTAVGVIGYLNTGKKALCKAIRQEGKMGNTQWLMDSIGRLRTPESETQDIGQSLHLCLRGIQPRGPAWSAATATAAADMEAGPLATCTHLLDRAQRTAVLRRFRLPAFATAAEFLDLYAKDRDLKSKKGKTMAPEAVARRVLLELPTTPGFCCVPREDGSGRLDGSLPVAALWQAHDFAKCAAPSKAIMAAQVATLTARDAGPNASAVPVTSRGPGPSVDVKGVAAETANDDDGDGGDAMSAEDGEDSGSEGWEEAEEEDMEGDESESGMSDAE